MLRVAILSTAHLHALGYVIGLANHPRAEIVGVWDDDRKRGEQFAERSELAFDADREALLARADAVVICSENRKHLDCARAAAAKGLAILCEKPVATTPEEAEALKAAVGDGLFMTAFPCRFHPSWPVVKAKAAEIGPIRGIVATNRGTCPGGWFVEEELAGGGAMIDHTVHVADLLRDLLGAEPTKVEASKSSAMYGRDTDDCALLTFDYPNGVYATLDSSWSRPAGFRTWGDVTLRITGENGVVSLDMFGPAIQLTRANGLHDLALSTDTDALMVDAFVRACLDRDPVVTTLEDGLAASRAAFAAYASAA